METRSPLIFRPQIGTGEFAYTKGVIRNRKWAENAMAKRNKTKG